MSDLRRKKRNDVRSEAILLLITEIDSRKALSGYGLYIYIYNYGLITIPFTL